MSKRRKKRVRPARVVDAAGSSDPRWVPEVGSPLLSSNIVVTEREPGDDALYEGKFPPPGSLVPYYRAPDTELAGGTILERRVMPVDFEQVSFVTARSDFPDLLESAAHFFRARIEEGKLDADVESVELVNDWAYNGDEGATRLTFTIRHPYWRPPGPS